MNDDRDEEAIFHLARRIPDPETRKDYLDQICAGDTALRERVEALLKSHEQQHSLLRSKAEQLLAEHEVGDTMSVAQSSNLNLSAGQKIGRFKLLQKVGEGGFGVVFMAEQSRPVRRKVALKVIKPGMDSNAVVARFEAERQALAMMDHPNIARVFDGGATDEGRPYFVMELVKGVPITEYCDKNKLPTKERLELFMTVCQAVQHAHQKGIIHRDLKPSNILVTLHDGQPMVKVIDFGVSKAINQQLTEKTLFTAFGQMVGTPQYMSPEQAEMSGLDVDTRSDVYSLGVLLYELLTGSTPLEAERLRTAGYVEMQRLIKEEEAPRPSNRLSTSGDKLTIIAQHRSISPDKLAKEIKGDLDWIVMKALEKESNRRYESASGFASDVKCFIRDEVVQARPPSRLYRYHKVWRRHRIALMIAATISVILVAMTSWALWENRRSKTALVKLRETAQTQAIVHALNRDDQRMQQMIDLAIQAGARPGWSEMVEAISALFSGNAELALGHLSDAQELGNDTLAVRSLQAEAHFYAGNVDEMLELGIPLKNEEPKGVQDRIFLSLFLTRVDQQRSFQLASEAFEMQRSPITLLAKAQARSHLAQDSGNDREAQLAMAEADAARMLLPNSGWAATVSIFTRSPIIIRARLSGNEQLVMKCTEETEAIADELLMNFPEYAFGHLVTGWFYEGIGNRRLAAPRYKEAVRLADKEFYRCTYAQCLSRMGALEDAKIELEKIDASIWKALIISEIDERREEAREMLSEHCKSADPNVRPLALGALCELGFGADAKKLADEILRGEAEPNKPADRDLLSFFAQRTKPDQLLSAMGDDRTDRAFALLVLGQCELGNQNLVSAKKYLNESISVLQIFMIYDRAEHLLHRLESTPAPWWNSDFDPDSKNATGSRD